MSVGVRMYLSRLLELDAAADSASICELQASYLSEEEKAERLQRLENIGHDIALSDLAVQGKELLLCSVEKYKAILHACTTGNEAKNTNMGNYAIVALASGAAGFGLGWHAKSAYDRGKREDAEAMAVAIAKALKG